MNTSARGGRGRLVVHRIASRALRDNPLGDPPVRDLYVYLPPGFPNGPAPGLPALMALAGFTGTGASLFNMDPLGEDLKGRLDRLISRGALRPAVVVAPDCFTRLGGNQYINSSATGRYEDYLVREVVPFVRSAYRVGRWGVFGKSSGGYGAALLAMRHPDVFEAMADHSGDSNFELCYLPDFPQALDRFREAGGPAAWLKAFWKDENRHRREHAKALNVLAMAAHYSPNPRSPHLGVDFPFDLETGVFRPQVWARWRAWDPVNLAGRYRKNLGRLRLIYVDCGDRDEFSLHWGARAFVAAMRRRGLKPVHREFADGHMSIAYRYDHSLPMLVRALG